MVKHFSQFSVFLGGALYHILGSGLAFLHRRDETLSPFLSFLILRQENLQMDMHVSDTVGEVELQFHRSWRTLSVRIIVTALNQQAPFALKLSFQFFLTG